jgi:cob(I)alamin adenosyltransferase
MKIYTRTGDTGQTGLFGGARSAKDALRIEACGAVDELNAQIGWAHSQQSDPAVKDSLAAIQNELFIVGGDIASPAASRVPRIHPEHVERLEGEIDRWEAELPPLRQFILPSGSTGGSAIHVARAVCRRAERRLVALARQEELNSYLLAYINRLSDYLFVLARISNTRAGAAETPWIHKTL